MLTLIHLSSLLLTKQHAEHAAALDTVRMWFLLPLGFPSFDNYGANSVPMH